FCTSRQCGPTLDQVKAVAHETQKVSFINVEPYKLEYANDRLQPVLDANGQLQATDVTNAWGLLTEPWVFVGDRHGILRAAVDERASLRVEVTEYRMDRCAVFGEVAGRELGPVVELADDERERDAAARA